MVMPRALVDPPRPERRPTGLLDYVDWQPDNGGRWLAGVEYLADCSGAETIALDVCGPSATGGVTGGFQETESRSMRGATSFHVYSQFSCAPVDFYSKANQLAEDALTRSEGWQVENAFWTGAITDDYAGNPAVVYPHLAEDAAVVSGNVTLQTAATVVVTGSGLDPKTALGILESALGDCYGGVGWIHVPQKIMTHLHGDGLLIRDGVRWRTANGNWVVPGAGYQGTSPAGAAPALETAWLYATSPVWGYRGDVTVFPPSSNLNRSVDTVTARAARPYLLTWDCCHLAVQVDASTS